MWIRLPLCGLQTQACRCRGSQPTQVHAFFVLPCFVHCDTFGESVVKLLECLHQTITHVMPCLSCLALSCLACHAMLVMPCSPCLACHALLVMPCLSCPPCHALLVMPSLSCPPCFALLVMPSLTCQAHARLYLRRDLLVMPAALPPMLLLFML